VWEIRTLKEEVVFMMSVLYTSVSILSQKKTLGTDTQILSFIFLTQMDYSASTELSMQHQRYPFCHSSMSVYHLQVVSKFHRGSRWSGERRQARPKSKEGAK
jgi:hypothetical protein